MLFIHGDQDGTCPYSSARTAYGELAAPKAFLTHRGSDHSSYLVPGYPTYPQTENTFLDWFRWSLYDDTAARDRLAADATSSGTSWESTLASYPSSVVTLRARANDQYVCAENAGADPLIANRASVGSWETFQRVNNADGTISLRAPVNNRYVSAENTGASPLVASSTAIGPGESFDLISA